MFVYRKKFYYDKFGPVSLMEPQRGAWMAAHL
jgi:hypothetical protein